MLARGYLIVQKVNQNIYSIQAGLEPGTFIANTSAHGDGRYFRFDTTLDTLIRVGQLPPPPAKRPSQWRLHALLAAAALVVWGFALWPRQTTDTALLEPRAAAVAAESTTVWLTARLTRTAARSSTKAARARMATMAKSTVTSLRSPSIELREVKTLFAMNFGV